MQSKISDLSKFEDLVYVICASLSLLYWLYIKWAGVINIATYVRDIQISIGVCKFVYTKYEVRTVMVLHIFSFFVSVVFFSVNEDSIDESGLLGCHDWGLRSAQSC